MCRTYPTSMNLPTLAALTALLTAGALSVTFGCSSGESKGPSGEPSSTGTADASGSTDTAAPSLGTSATGDADGSDDPAIVEERCDVERFLAQCTIGCPHGTRNNPPGCDLCECSATPRALQMAGCPETITCAQRCAHGYMTDARGCFTCECRIPTPDEDPEDPICDVAKFDAECTIGCPKEYAKGPDGCDICQCMRHPEELKQVFGCDFNITCPQRCPRGVGYRRDAQGCPTCECGRPD